MDNGKSEETDYDYAKSGKIMLIAIVVLFIVIIIMLCFHVQIRWHLLRARRQQHLRRTRHVRPPQFVFYVDPAAPSALTLAASRGLDASVISSLPVFNFSPKTHPEAVECAVCLSEFEDGETGRILPKCSHSFHIYCIDMWFQSHSTCPLCRAPVEPLPAQETRPEITVTVREPESGPGSSSGPEQAVSSPSCSIGKPSSLGAVTVEVPGRSQSFGGVSGGDSSSSSFRSPMSRVLSFTRILSRERKVSVSPSSGCVAMCGSVTELDAERGGSEETQCVVDENRS